MKESGERVSEETGRYGKGEKESEWRMAKGKGMGGGRWREGEREEESRDGRREGIEGGDKGLRKGEKREGTDDRDKKDPRWKEGRREGRRRESK